MTDKTAIFSHFSDILDNMIDSSSFFKYFFQRPSYTEDIEGTAEDAAVPEGIAVRFGATRACIIDDNYDYVIKFDIDEDERQESVCECEENIYQHACECGLGKYFARIQHLGIYCKTIEYYDFLDVDNAIAWECYEQGIEEVKEFEETTNYKKRTITIMFDLYFCDKATNYKHRLSTEEHMKKYEPIARATKSPLVERYVWLAVDFIDFYGVGAFYALSDFLREHRVNDLHYGNAGIIDGKPVLIDYAGYHDICDEYSW